MFEAREDALLVPGTWKKGPPPTVFFACPYCSIILMVDWEVQGDGTVLGDVHCASLKCTFDRPVRFLGWRP